MKPSYKAKYGNIFTADSLKYMVKLEDEKVNLIMTSPPRGLVRKKDYDNADAHEYIDWFKPFAEQFSRILTNDGSLVIDMGGSWISGQPTRSHNHYELMIMLCREFGFNLAQDFFWWNPSKVPISTKWDNICRIRVKDTINCVWWLTKKPKKILNRCESIHPILITISNNESNSSYFDKCKKFRIKPHPARKFPVDLPEFFIRMLTDKGDLVLDPFAGSCVTGEASERLERKWICVEQYKEYVTGAKVRFPVKSLVY